MFDRIEYMNYSDPIIRIIRIICNTFKRLKLGQIMLQKAQNSEVSDNVYISYLNIQEFFAIFISF